MFGRLHLSNLSSSRTILESPFRLSSGVSESRLLKLSRQCRSFHKLISSSRIQHHAGLASSVETRSASRLSFVPLRRSKSMSTLKSAYNSGTRPSKTTKSASISSSIDHSLVESFPSSSVTSIPRPSFEALQALFLASAIPMLGFGFMDNFVMIQAGQYIDNTLGAQLGLATMTAAAAGQVVSDVSGVIFGGSLERWLSRLGLVPRIALTERQRQLPLCRNVRMAGAVIGVMVGCALGAVTLLFVDVHARDRQEHAQQLTHLVAQLVEAEDALHCRNIVIHAPFQPVAKQPQQLEEYSSTSAEGHEQESIHPTRLQELDDASSEAVRECAKTRQICASENSLLVPVIVNHNVAAVVELENSASVDLETSDRGAAQRLAKHVGIIMHQLLRLNQ